MAIWVVRHACAGHKQDWTGVDDERPLDPAGAEQARALAQVLAADPPSVLVSSPARRCMDTFAPLSEITGIATCPDDSLRRADADALLDRLLDPASEGAAFCTHGEAMAPTLKTLRLLGVSFGDRSDDDLLLKGAAWRLERTRSGWTLDLSAPRPLKSCPRHEGPS